MKMIKNGMMMVAVVLLMQAGLVQAQQPVIAVVDLESALFNTDAARELEARVREELRDDEERLNRLNSELRELVERAQRDESIMSDAEMRRLNSDAQEKQIQMQVIAERLEEAWGQRRFMFVESMRPFLGQAVESVVQQGNYDLVFNADQLTYFSSGYNITAQVTARINELAR